MSGETPRSSADGTSALAVAACEYSSMLAKKNTTASSQGDCFRMSPETALMSSMWALMKVSPSQATPRWLHSRAVSMQATKVVGMQMASKVR